MKSLLKLVVVFFMTAFISMDVFSQDADKISKIMERDLAVKVEVMKLNADQQAKLRSVLKVYYVDRMEAKQLTGKEKGQKMREVNAKLEEGMAAICTPEQLASWKKHVEEEKAAKKQKKM